MSKIRLFKRDGLWHYACPCCHGPDGDRPNPVPHRDYEVMLAAAEAHLEVRAADRLARFVENDRFND